MKLFLIGFTWVLFCVFHSYASTNACKERICSRFTNLVPHYRLLYNAIAIVTLMIPLSLVWSWHGPDLYAPADMLAVVDRLLQLVAVCGFLWTLWSYDLGALSGIGHSPAEPATLRMSGPLSICRHPLYFFSLVLLWSGSQNAATLLTATLLTLYIFIGIRIEENRLTARFGEAYLQYKKQVPMLVPWRSFRFPAKL